MCPLWIGEFGSEGGIPTRIVRRRDAGRMPRTGESMARHITCKSMGIPLKTMAEHQTPLAQATLTTNNRLPPYEYHLKRWLVAAGVSAG